MIFNQTEIQELANLEVIAKQIALGKRYKIKVSKMTAKLSKLYLLLFIFFVAAIIYVIVTKNLLIFAIVVVVIISLFLPLIIINIKKRNQIRDSKRLIKHQVDFQFDPFWDLIMKDSNIRRNREVSNISFNNQVFMLDEKGSTIILTSEFYIDISASYVMIVKGKQYANMFSKVEKTVLEHEAYRYKYKELSHQRWQHQRKDGGPDRRFADNQLYSYYRYKLVVIKGIKFNVPDFTAFNRFISKLDYETISLKIAVFPVQARVNQINFRSLDSIVAYLDEKNVLYNYYGGELEFKINQKIFIIKEKDLKSTDFILKLKNTIGRIYYDKY